MSVDAPRFWEEVRLGEDTGLALKEAQFRGQQVSAPHRDGLADGLAAFANSGGGRLVLGVADDRKPQSLVPNVSALASANVPCSISGATSPSRRPTGRCSVSASNSS